MDHVATNLQDAVPLQFDAFTPYDHDTQFDFLITNVAKNLMSFVMLIIIYIVQPDEPDALTCVTM